MLIYRVGHPNYDHKGPYIAPADLPINGITNLWGKPEHSALPGFWPEYYLYDHNGDNIEESWEELTQWRSGLRSTKALKLFWTQRTMAEMTRAGYKLYTIEVPDDYVRSTIYWTDKPRPKREQPKYQVSFRWPDSKILSIDSLEPYHPDYYVRGIRIGFTERALKRQQKESSTKTPANLQGGF